MMMPLTAASQIIGEGATALHLFAFPKTMVRNVIFGCRMTESKRTEIREILNAPDYQHVHCTEVRLDDTRYRLVVADDDPLKGSGG